MRRADPPSMKKMSRREALQGACNPVAEWFTVVRTDFKNSGFIDLAVPLLGLGWALTQRGETAKKLLALEAESSDDRAQAPKIVVAAARAAGKVQVNIIGPSLDGEIVDYLWLRDADTGALLGSKALESNGGLPGSKSDPTYTGLVESGQRVVPYLHCSSSGLWKGQPFVARL